MSSAAPIVSRSATSEPTGASKQEGEQMVGEDAAASGNPQDGLRRLGAGARSGITTQIAKGSRRSHCTSTIRLAVPRA